MLQPLRHTRVRSHRDPGVQACSHTPTRTQTRATAGRYHRVPGPHSQDTPDTHAEARGSQLGGARLLEGCVEDRRGEAGGIWTILESWGAQAPPPQGRQMDVSLCSSSGGRNRIGKGEKSAGGGAGGEGEVG